MCSRLVESVECYMENLVDSFEDFVRKSLLVISVGIVTVVAMMGYVLKTITRQNQLRAGQVDSAFQTNPVTNYISSEKSLYSDQLKSTYNYSRDSIRKSRASEKSKAVSKSSLTSLDATRSRTPSITKDSKTMKMKAVKESISNISSNTSLENQSTNTSGYFSPSNSSRIPQKRHPNGFYGKGVSKSLITPTKSASDTGSSPIAVSKASISPIRGSGCPMSIRPSCEETLMNEIGLDDYVKPPIPCQCIVYKHSPNRLTIPSQPICSSAAPTIIPRTSCCSLCCDDS